MYTETVLHATQNTIYYKGNVLNVNTTQNVWINLSLLISVCAFNAQKATL